MKESWKNVTFNFLMEINVLVAEPRSPLQLPTDPIAQEIHESRLLNRSNYPIYQITCKTQIPRDRKVKNTPKRSKKGLFTNIYCIFGKSDCIYLEFGMLAYMYI